MKNYKPTITQNPFMINIKGVGTVNLHNISDKLAEKLHNSGSTLVEPIPETTPKTKPK